MSEPMKSFGAMAAEWNRILATGWDDRATIEMREYAAGAIAALNWAYSKRAERPSTRLRIDTLPWGP